MGRLGTGGMGQVFLAISPGGRRVAVKLISPARAAQFRDRFAREIEAARRVGGFHTAPVVDADPHADPPWMATAYIDGPSLEEAVSGGGPLPPEEVRALGVTIPVPHLPPVPPVVQDRVPARDLTLRGPNGAAYLAVTFSPDGRLLAVADSGTRSTEVWNVATGKLIATRQGRMRTR